MLRIFSAVYFFDSFLVDLQKKSYLLWSTGPPYPGKSDVGGGLKFRRQIVPAKYKLQYSLPKLAYNHKMEHRL